MEQEETKKLTRDAFLKCKEEVLSSFDFEKVKRVMHLLQWEWYDGEQLQEPSLYTIITRASEMLDEAYEKYDGDYFFTECGGFRVLIFHDEEVGDIVKLEFVAVHTEASELD